MNPVHTYVFRGGIVKIVVEASETEDEEAKHDFLVFHARLACFAMALISENHDCPGLPQFGRCKGRQ